MIRQALFFSAPLRVDVREEEIPEPGPGQVVVETHLSGISAGSELLVYRGEAPEDMDVDRTIPALSGRRLAFPLKYGYSAVGRVILLGPEVNESWLECLAFSFQPHQSHFVARTTDLFPLPEGVTPEAAIFLPHIETAVNLVMDGRPLIGEAVMVCGQGLVGLMTTALLSRFPLGKLVTLDYHPLRRRLSKELGAAESLDPADPRAPFRLTETFAASGGADLVFEVSGNPGALDGALEVCGFGGRVVIGSWYGRKQVTMKLGGKFHRDRIKLISSQVSTLAPGLTGRWSKTRRLGLVWRWLREIDPGRFITSRFPIDQAGEAYERLHRDPSRDLQVLFTYPGPR